MRTTMILTTLLLGAFFAPTVHADVADVGLDAACAPPCGPIPAIITIFLDKSKGLVFENNLFETDGRVQYFFDVDNDGYVFDPTGEVKITMGVNKQPPWVKTTIEPTEATIPVNDPRYIKDDGSAQAKKFEYEFPIHVKVEKLYDPTYDEVKKYTKSDGTYRIMINAYSNSSMAGTDPTGRPAGLQEGYGIKELRFISAEEPGFQAGSMEPQGNAPGVGTFAFLVAVGAVLVLLRRRD